MSFGEKASRLHIGKLPGKKGIYLYELDCDVYRILGLMAGVAGAERFLKFRSHPIPHDLAEGRNCEVEIEGFSDPARKGHMQRRKPITGELE